MPLLLMFHHKYVVARGQGQSARAQQLGRTGYFTHVEVTQPLFPAEHCRQHCEAEGRRFECSSQEADCTSGLSKSFYRRRRQSRAAPRHLEWSITGALSPLLVTSHTHPLGVLGVLEGQKCVIQGQIFAQ